MTRFTTEQFIRIASHSKDVQLIKWEDFDPETLIQRFLKQDLLKEIDDRRQDLNMDTLTEMSGFPDEGYKGELNYDFVKYMNDNLNNVSIISMPCIDHCIDRIDRWDWTHHHFIVGRSPNTSDLIGYYTFIMWT